MNSSILELELSLASCKWISDSQVPREKYRMCLIKSLVVEKAKLHSNCEDILRFSVVLEKGRSYHLEICINLTCTQHWIMSVMVQALPSVEDLFLLRETSNSDLQTQVWFQKDTFHMNWEYHKRSWTDTKANFFWVHLEGGGLGCLMLWY